MCNYNILPFEKKIVSSTENSTRFSPMSLFNLHAISARVKKGICVSRDILEKDLDHT